MGGCDGADQPESVVSKMNFNRCERWLWRWPYSLALGAMHAAYLWVFLNPCLFVDRSTQFPAFLTTRSFMQSFLVRPGGPSEYLGAWLSQGMVLGWLGALIFTAVTAGLCLAFGRLLMVLSGRPRSWLAVLPATFALIAYNGFGFYLPQLLALALALGAAAGYAALLSRRLPLRAVAFIALALVLHYLLGGASILFVVLCAILEAACGGGALTGLLWLLAGSLPPLVFGRLLPEVGVLYALAHHTPADPDMPASDAIVFGLLWGLLVAASALTALRAWETRRVGEPPPGWLQRHTAVRRLLIVALVAGPVAATCHPWLRPVVQVERLVREGRYQQALAQARRVHMAELPIHFTHAVNLALFHTGRLSDELLTFPQIPDGLMLGMQCGSGLSPGQVREMRRTHPYVCTDALLELGLLNQATHEASESLEANGPQVPTLLLLSKAYLARGQPEAARRFLADLARSPRRAAWGLARLAQLDTTGQVRDERIEAAARNQLRQDTHCSDLLLEGQCLALLQANPANRMAYEYLMNTYLLNRALDRFISHLEGLERAGLTRVPRHWQEAIALWEAKTGKRVGLSGYQIDPAVYAQFASFSAVVAPLQQGGADRETLIRAAGPDFGNTYFFYYITVQSGVGRR